MTKTKSEASSAPLNQQARSIVCGMDFTEPARHAASVACVLARALDARLELIHVIDLAGFALRDDAQRKRETIAATDALQGEAQRLGKAHDVAVTARVITGSPAQRLVDAAAEVGACLIVLAAVGPTPSIFRVGGTPERVLQAARIPVLLVRDPAPLVAWLEGERLPVAAFVAEDAASDRVLDWVRTLRSIRACDVTLLRAYYSNEAAASFGLSPRPLVMRDPEVESILQRHLMSRAEALGGEGTCESAVTFAIGRQAEALLAHPSARAAELIVVGNHRARGLARLSSVAANVVHLADASVLVVPATAPVLVEAPWPQFKRILVATDFSPFSTWALKHAYGLAGATGGTVIVLHALDSVARDDSERAHAEALARMRQLIPDHAPVGVTTELEAVVEPDASAAIVQSAARVAADCIVIASHGNTGVRKVLMGSTAQAVVQRSRLPVLIIRPPRDW